MSAINRLGTQVELPDGRVGTVVYNGLDGVGIKWGLHDPTEEEVRNSTGGLTSEQAPPEYEWFPDAMLRAPYPEHLRNLQGRGLEYVGNEYTITRVGGH